MSLDLSRRALLSGAGAMLFVPSLLPVAAARAQDGASPMLLAYPR